jgi:cation diffusion facilitator CzcD-associated flavoprotein CzcO
MAAEQVCVVGGANSTGQIVLHLAKFRRRVTLLARGKSLAASMSDYLITQQKATPTSKSGRDVPRAHGRRDGRAAGPAGHVWASELSPEDGGRVAVDLPEQVVDSR